MEQGINLGYVMFRRNSVELRPLLEAVRLCKAAGFTEYDYLGPWSGDDFLENARRSKDVFDSEGVHIHQTHCPFFRYKENGIELFRKAAPRAVEISAVLGAKYMVMHADEWPMADTPYSCGLAVRKNYEIVAPIVEACLRNNVTPVFENVFDEGRANGDNGRDRFGAVADELLALLDMLGKGDAGICRDTGHAYVSAKGEILDFARKVAPYVLCTHIHDNKSSSDLHQPAFAGTIPMEEIFAILKENGYGGNLTWEMVYGRYPDQILPDFLALLHKSGQYLGAR